jgi:hypothetical protein
MIRARTKPDQRVCQGDIIRDVEYLEHVDEKDGILELSKIHFPFVIVLTQDCDLEQDHTFRTQTKQTRDKWLISVLIAPIYNAEHVFGGEHLLDIDIKSEQINKKGTDGKSLIRNQKPRYHYLEFPSNIPIVPSVVDFKHYFSVPVNYLCELKKTNYVCTVSELYRENLSQRFAAFLSRIAFPDLSANKSLIESLPLHETTKGIFIKAFTTIETLNVSDSNKQFAVETLNHILIEIGKDNPDTNMINSLYEQINILVPTIAIELRSVDEISQRLST